jgi:hypothetical protein
MALNNERRWIADLMLSALTMNSSPRTAMNRSTSSLDRATTMSMSRVIRGRL